jgi:hypothetical protein
MAKQLLAMKEVSNINSYMSKMRRAEERQLSREMQLEERRSRLKAPPLSSLTFRVEQEEKLVKTRSCLFEQKMQNQERNWQMLQTSRKNETLKRSDREREVEAEFARRK